MCKLKKVSNAPKKPVEGEEGNAEDELEGVEAEVGAGEAPVLNGKASKKRKSSLSSLQGALHPGNK